MRTCNGFFERMEAIGLAVTYDEVRLKTNYSRVPPTSVSLETRFSRRVPLKIPIVSAAMDTVTERKMAIAIAKLGGIGVIHRNLTPLEQKEEVRRVKYHLSGMINNPVTVAETVTLREMDDMRTQRHFSFHTFPVLDAEGRLVGLITQNDFDFCEDLSQTAANVMTRDLITANPETSVDEAFRKMRAAKKKVLPLVDAEGRLAGMYLFSDLVRIKSGSSSGFNVDERGRLRVAAAVGTGKEALSRVDLLHHYVDAIVIDTAHGDSQDVFDTLREIKRAYDVDVVAGNISEYCSAKRLLEAGADGIKVGQGPGSICTTRIVAGIGCPQVTAVHKVAWALEESGVPLCADGGIESSGDIAIAIGAGANSVMLGKLLAGTKEAPGRLITIKGRKYKQYRGMGSLGAMAGGECSDRYFQESHEMIGRTKFVPEGVEGAIPYRGTVSDTIYQLIGGMRSSMGYCGAANIKEMQEKAHFIRVTPSGMTESHPHDIMITDEAPNYPLTLRQ
jgi:IMP dehydrogenase